MRWRRGGVIVVLFAVVTAVFDLLFPPPLHRAEALSPLVVDRNGEWLHAFATPEGRWRFAANLDAIDPIFIERLILVEDKRFYTHFGVDPLAVVRAGTASAKAGAIVSGASTITMQTARLLEPRPRTIPAKAIEMIRALQIERRLTKQEILELYLTLAPYGGNIEGVRAASRLYFDKDPIRLTDAEQALLIALPQAPEARRPDTRDEASRMAREKMLQKLVEGGAISQTRADEAAAARLPAARHQLPRLAYHAGHRLARQNAIKSAASVASMPGVIASSLDAALQIRAEAMLAEYVKHFDDDATASLLIVDNKTRSVRAAVGSSSFDVQGGWIDLTDAVRSPGSTLKPFIYALAFEGGYASADTVIDDMPRAFGDYAPENFDRTFRGEVHMREALQHSLNVPAVRALDRIGASRFASLLRSAGVRLRMPARADAEPGLALALGGAGVTAREIASLYAALATDGSVRPLLWKLDDETGDHKSQMLFSKDTAARVSAILADAPALAGRAPASLSVSATRVAFKTGTSYGFRDAWAAGHGGAYTVVVWVGRADGAPRPGATGRAAAAPLLFDVFDMLDREEGASQPQPQDEEATPMAFAQFNRSKDREPPQIIFPRDGVEVYLGKDDRGFSLAARGGAPGKGGHRWYVNGAPIAREQTSGRHIWRPVAAGFYDIVVVDAEGRAAQAKIRVVSG